MIDDFKNVQMLPKVYFENEVWHHICHAHNHKAKKDVAVKSKKLPYI